MPLYDACSCGFPFLHLPTWVSSVVAQLKSQSASMLRKKFQWLQRVYWKENIVWSPGYFVSSVGIDEKVILKYVEQQGRQDSGQLVEL